MAAAALPARQQRKALVEAAGELFERQRAQPHRGKLDGQGYAVEPPAQPDHVGQVVEGGGEAGDRGRRALEEQLRRAARDGVLLGLTRDRQRGDGAGVLAAYVERFPARGQQGDARRPRDDRLGEHRARVDEVLAGVQDQQEVAVAQVGEHRVQVGTVGLLGEAERARDRVHQEPGLAQRGQLDQADTVGEAWRRRRGGAQREAALADAARAGHRDQPGLFKQRAQPGELCLPADETGRLDRELPVPNIPHSPPGA